MKRFLTLAASALVLAACNGDPSGVSIENDTFAPSLGVNLAASTQTTNGVYYRDITAGTGAAVASGSSVQVRYAGYLSNGTLFDSNPAPEALLSFTIGAANIIDGLQEGMLGMQAGGQRQIIIPWRLGYGSTGNSSGNIPPFANLVFTIDAVVVN